MRHPPDKLLTRAAARVAVKPTLVSAEVTASSHAAVPVRMKSVTLSSVAASTCAAQVRQRGRSAKVCFSHLVLHVGPPQASREARDVAQRHAREQRGLSHAILTNQSVAVATPQRKVARAKQRTPCKSQDDATQVKQLVVPVGVCRGDAVRAQVLRSEAKAQSRHVC
jgi:hypothetical protein